MIKSNNGHMATLTIRTSNPTLKKGSPYPSITKLSTKYHAHSRSINTRCYNPCQRRWKLRLSTPRQHSIEWLLQCTCISTTCTCIAPTRPTILSPHRQQPHVPITQTSPNIIHFKEFTCCHDMLPTTAAHEKPNKYDPLVYKGWIVNLLITITTRARGAIHKLSIIQTLEKSHILPREIKHLVDTYTN